MPNSSPFHNTFLYGRRIGRPLRAHKQSFLQNLLPHLSFHLTSTQKLPTTLFPQEGPVWIEIGYGTGDHLIAQMESHPSCNMIGCEPFLGGVAHFLEKLFLKKLSLTHIRLYTQDAQTLLKSLDPESIQKIFLLFPDPWPKKKHLKRRFFQ